MTQTKYKYKDVYTRMVMLTKKKSMFGNPLSKVYMSNGVTFYILTHPSQIRKERKSMLCNVFEDIQSRRYHQNSTIGHQDEGN